MSAVHKGKHVYRIKTLRLEIRFVISLQANPRAWEKKGKHAVRRDTREVCATTVVESFS